MAVESSNPARASELINCAGSQEIFMEAPSLKKTITFPKAITNLLKPANDKNTDFLPISKNILAAILVLQLFLVISTVLDVFVSRQVLGFLFLTFIPGYLLLKTAKIKLPSLHSTILFSAGASLFFLMIVGLLLNTALPLIVFEKPLSELSILLSINIVVLAECTFLWINCKSPSLSPTHYTKVNFSKRHLPLVVLLVFLIATTLIGTEIARVTNNSAVLMFSVVLVSLIVLFALSNKLIPAKAYPIVILIIAFFLLFHVSLISNYLVGYDVHLEAYFAQTTFSNSQWNSSILNPYNAMTSITILPTIYSNFLNYDIYWVLKIVYPLIYLLVPVALYFVYRKQTSSAVAFLGVFFLMSMETFYVQMLGLTRQMIGEFFLVLILLLVVDKRIDIIYKKILLLVFSFGIIMSHYSIFYISLFFFLVAYSIAAYFKRADDKAPRLITGKYILAYGLVGVFWYLFMVPGASTSLVDAINSMYYAIISNAPAPGVAGLIPVATSLTRQFVQVLFYTLQFFIIVGLASLLLKRKVSRLSPEYSAMAFAGLLILIASMILPNFAASLNIARFYHVAIIVLAPFCVLGGLKIGSILGSKILRKKKVGNPLLKRMANAWKIFIALIIVSFFLYQVGFVYQISGDVPISNSLSRNRLDYPGPLLLDADTREISGCQWLSHYSQNISFLYTDSISNHYVLSYGLVQPDKIAQISPGLQYASGNLSENTMSFLGWDTFERAKVYGFSQTWNVTEFSFFSNQSDKVFTNGGSDIYYIP